jgi:hypothetical protein
MTGKKWSYLRLKGKKNGLMEEWRGNSASVVPLGQLKKRKEGTRYLLFVTNISSQKDKNAPNRSNNDNFLPEAPN